MPRIIQVSIDDVISRAPVVEPIDANWIAEKPPTMYVCAQGFEERFDAIATLIASLGVCLERSVVLSLRSNSEKDRENGRRLIEMLTPHSTIPPVVVDGDDPAFRSNFESALGGTSVLSSAATDVLLDVSVAANRLCLRSLNFLLKQECSLTVAYAEAAIYHPEQSAFVENEAAWMSDDSLGTEKGVENIRPSEEFPGEHLDAASNVVVLLPSFRHERSSAIISHIDPALLTRPTDDVIWILGCPHLEKDVWRRDVMRKINRISEDAKVLEASTFDYRETWRLLESLYRERWETSNITVSPLGSKMQALAVTLFCLRHPDVRVLFSIPQQYNIQQWSEGVRDVWRVSFGPSLEFLKEICDAGSLQLEGVNT